MYAYTVAVIFRIPIHATSRGMHCVLAEDIPHAGIGRPPSCPPRRPAGPTSRSCKAKLASHSGTRAKNRAPEPFKPDPRGA